MLVWAGHRGIPAASLPDKRSSRVNCEIPRVLWAAYGKIVLRNLTIGAQTANVRTPQRSLPEAAEAAGLAMEPIPPR